MDVDWHYSCRHHRIPGGGHAERRREPVENGTRLRRLHVPRQTGFAGMVVNGSPRIQYARLIVPALAK